MVDSGAEFGGAGVVVMGSGVMESGVMGVLVSSAE